MPVESEVHVSGKGNNIHYQRDPMRGRRGYYVRGWTPSSNDDWRLAPSPFDPEVDCPDCEGRGFVLNDEVNKHRSHYMQYHACPLCEGKGCKPPGK